MASLRVGLVCLWVGAFGFAGCSDDDSGEISTDWTFASGDCASNGVESVKVALTGDGFFKDAVFACSAGGGNLGSIPPGMYQVRGEGFDADGVLRAQNLGQSTEFSEGFTGPISVVLRPKASEVLVTWNGCPGSVVLPYFITLYEAPAEAGGELTTEVVSAQEGCATGEVGFPDIAPGEYVVEVDSRAITPAVSGRAPVTVVAGEDAEVAVDVP